MSILAFYTDSYWNSLVLIHRAMVRAHLQSGFVGAQITLMTGKPLLGSPKNQIILEECRYKLLFTDTKSSFIISSSSRVPGSSGSLIVLTISIIEVHTNYISHHRLQVSATLGRHHSCPHCTLQLGLP